MIKFLEINLTEAQTLPTKPVSVHQLVRIPVQSKVMKCNIVDSNLNKYFLIQTVIFFAKIFLKNITKVQDLSENQSG